MIAVLIGMILAVLMLPPLWILLQDSVTTTDAIGDVTGFTTGHFRKLFTDRDALTSIWNSLVFAAGSTVLSLLMGGALAWLVVVAAEMIAVNSGLGYLIIDARNAGKRYDLVVAGMVMIGLIGLVLDLLVRQLEKFDEVRWGYGKR